MKESCEHTNPLTHQGTSQSRRFLEALDPAKVELHSLQEGDWLEFAYEYARLVNYYATDDAETPRGNWQDFFENKEELIKQLESEEQQGDTEPHLSLFIAFLKLLVYPQQSLNALPKRHLDFYYKEVLKLEKQPYNPDMVHVLFELAKHASDELVEEGVLLKAGKDSEGNPLNYQTVDSLVVNAAKVTSLRSVYMDDNGILRHAPIANSADGLGADFEDDRTWRAFGEPTGFSWPEAELSFYLASNLLELREGTRMVTLEFELSDSLSLDAGSSEAFFTGEKEWLGSFGVDIGPSQPVVGKDTFKSVWTITVGIEDDAILKYNEEVHLAGLETKLPVLKIVFQNAEDYEALKSIKIEKLELSVTASDIETLQLQNELGNLDPSKPFMPFGSSPKVGSRLKVAYPEMYGKPVSRFELSMMWLNLPANFSEHYEHYLSSINDFRLAYTDIVTFVDYSSYAYYQYLYPPTDIVISENGTDEPLPDTMKDDFKVSVTSPYNTTPETEQLFTDRPQVTVDSEGGPLIATRGEIELALTESFYHDLYPELYTNAVLLAIDTKDADLPNMPYTPLLDQLTLSYTASHTVSFAQDTEEDNVPVSVMYHRHPFGVKRVDGDSNTLLPDYKHKHLYIGLENLEEGSNISLLFQVAEGSENPLHSNFEETESPSWSILSNNEWLPIEGSDFARNEVNNFLRSGIVEIKTPKEADSDNSLFDGEMHWLKIELIKEPDAVPRFIDIHAQAVKAEFLDEDNTTDHLVDHLPAETITQMVNPRARIKGVAQPYDSFGGAPAEADEAFYRRVSERLRHKHRTISIWDYEHLVLEEFPSLYKVKCLNHARLDGTVLDELSPGNAIIVLIPKLTEANTEFRLEPKVSRDFKDRVEDFVSSQNSMHATVTAADAIFEKVRFEFNIRYSPGLDFNFYRNQTMEDLKKLLAPWVFDLDAAINFGGTFTEYQIVNYLENLDYVDYIEDFVMFHKPVNGIFSKKTTVEPSNPMAILVPVENHVINQAIACS